MQRIEAMGGLALKLQMPGVRGFPDRTIMFGRRIFFVEFKRSKGGKISTQQTRWAERLRKAGFAVHFIDSETEFEHILWGHMDA